MQKCPNHRRHRVPPRRGFHRNHIVICDVFINRFNLRLPLFATFWQFAPYFHLTMNSKRSVTFSWLGVRPKSRKSWWKGNGFRWVSLFTLPFRPLLPWKGNGFRWVSLFTLPFHPLPPSKGNEFRWVSLFTLPFRPLLPSKGNGFWQFSLFSLPFGLLSCFKGNKFR